MTTSIGISASRRLRTSVGRSYQRRGRLWAEGVPDRRRALKPGGRVALVEYRGEDPAVPIKELHKMTEDQARREMQAVRLRWRETLSFLSQQHILKFEKPAPAAD